MLTLLLLACTHTEPAPAPTGCAACHTVEQAPHEAAHRSLPCETCHLGDREAPTKEAAHRGLEREPGALDTVEQTCGLCHPDEITRVRRSIMTTNRGLLAVNRWAMGELPSPESRETMAQTLASPNPSPAQDYARHLCAGCHLGTRRDNRDDAIGTKGSGCAACHYMEGEGHGDVSRKVTDARCLGCHSRSARISLSYQGLAEVKGLGAERCEINTLLHDGRQGCRQPDDAHHSAGLGCIDCHLHTELMGDGTSHAHEEEQVELRCESCHGPEAPSATWAEISDPSSQALLRQAGEVRGPTEPVRTGRRGTPLWNLRPTDQGGWALRSKLDGRLHPVPQTPTDADHQLKGHERLSCAACHARWAPSCPDCHVSHETQGAQWDFAAAAERPGRWVESSRVMGWAPPTLALSGERVLPAMPGMVYTASLPPGEVTQRLYATLDPHTTQRRARTCAGCHRSGHTLGLGQGQLHLDGSHVEMVPTRPPDRWTTLNAEGPAQGTRPTTRSFSSEELQRIVRAGVCVICHNQAEDKIYLDFSMSVAARIRKAGECTGELPQWLDKPQE